ncbi:hypothetical protein SDRG_04673 [Saprolegnia diclina VS20]|uniref:SAP domain-containing protein n=1 Tax=Saprolegnia diclina (strain VS20) TaxID=1156394 RepID=T0S683_SAPDV|nr:hypothetical protein SDRG_04673 [Saprolegnia diclina VS20]EQC38247.1 hypothetical protein SDRG_04673 [Saprolegnia diclina VS20]|eukprot:XP_008608574.1 hypothetical protein SDRG_04673 [Saprolegnia diclina VS20]
MAASSTWLAAYCMEAAQELRRAPMKRTRPRLNLSDLDPGSASETSERPTKKPRRGKKRGRAMADGAAPSTPTDTKEEELMKLRVVDLKKKLQTRGLVCYGLKAVLVLRLAEAMRQEEMALDDDDGPASIDGNCSISAIDDDSPAASPWGEIGSPVPTAKSSKPAARNPARSLADAFDEEASPDPSTQPSAISNEPSSSASMASPMHSNVDGAASYPPIDPPAETPTHEIAILLKTPPPVPASLSDSKGLSSRMKSSRSPIVPLSHAASPTAPLHATLVQVAPTAPDNATTTTVDTALVPTESERASNEPESLRGDTDAAPSAGDILKSTKSPAETAAVGGRPDLMSSDSSSQSSDDDEHSTSFLAKGFATIKSAMQRHVLGTSVRKTPPPTYIELERLSMAPRRSSLVPPLSVLDLSTARLSPVASPFDAPGIPEGRLSSPELRDVIERESKRLRETARALAKQRVAKERSLSKAVEPLFQEPPLVEHDQVSAASSSRQLHPGSRTSSVAAPPSALSKRPPNLVSGLTSFGARKRTSSTCGATMIPSLLEAERSRLADEKKMLEKELRREALHQKYAIHRKHDDSVRKKPRDEPDKVRDEAAEKKQRDLDAARKRRLQCMHAAQEAKKMQEREEREKAREATEKKQRDFDAARKLRLHDMYAQEAKKVPDRARPTHKKPRSTGKPAVPSVQHATLKRLKEPATLPKCPVKTKMSAKGTSSRKAIKPTISGLPTKRQKITAAKSVLEVEPPASYTMSEPEESDESDMDTEDYAALNKPLPAWAQKANLDQALAVQFGPHGVDPSTIFPDFVGSCDLKLIFEGYVEPKRSFHRRTSSGNWHMDQPTRLEKAHYKHVMGFGAATTFVA